MKTKDELTTETYLSICYKLLNTSIPSILYDEYPFKVKASDISSSFLKDLFVYLVSYDLAKIETLEKDGNKEPDSIKSKFNRIVRRSENTCVQYFHFNYKDVCDLASNFTMLPPSLKITPLQIRMRNPDFMKIISGCTEVDTPNNASIHSENVLSGSYFLIPLKNLENYMIVIGMLCTRNIAFISKRINCVNSSGEEDNTVYCWIHSECFVITNELDSVTSDLSDFITRRSGGENIGQMIWALVHGQIDDGGNIVLDWNSVEVQKVRFELEVLCDNGLAQFDKRENGTFVILQKGFTSWLMNDLQDIDDRVSFRKLSKHSGK